RSQRHSPEPPRSARLQGARKRRNESTHLLLVQTIDATEGKKNAVARLSSFIAERFDDVRVTNRVICLLSCDHFAEKHRADNSGHRQRMSTGSSLKLSLHVFASAHAPTPNFLGVFRPAHSKITAQLSNPGLG